LIRFIPYLWYDQNIRHIGRCADDTCVRNCILIILADILMQRNTL